MRIELRDSNGRRLTRVEIDERARPARVEIPGGQALFPRWDEAIDDSGALRRCVVCGCDQMYRRKNFPQVTPLIIVLAFSGAAATILGLVRNPLIFVGLAALLALDVAVLILGRTRLNCYGCGAVYGDLRIARYHQQWDRAIADRIGKEPIDLPTVLIEAEPSREPEKEPGSDDPNLKEPSQ